MKGNIILSTIVSEEKMYLYLIQEGYITEEEQDWGLILDYTEYLGYFPYYDEINKVGHFIQFLGEMI